MRRRMADKGWRRVIGAALKAGDCKVAGIMLATHADDAGFSNELPTDADHRVASLHAQISRRDDDTRRSGPGSCSVRHCAERVQLDHRQLRAPCGVDLFGKPRRIPSPCVGPDRSYRTIHKPRHDRWNHRPRIHGSNKGGYARLGRTSHRVASKA